MNEKDFPLTFGCCPACGCIETVAGLVAEEEKAKGKILEGFTPCMGQEVTAIADPRQAHRVLRVPMLAAYFDVCAGCGCYYCTRVERGEGMPVPKDKTPFIRGTS